MSLPARKNNCSPTETSPRGKSLPSKSSPYDLHPTYSTRIPLFFDCKSGLQKGLMGIMITYLKETNRYQALEDFAKCEDPTKMSSYKHMVAVCMGQTHPADFVKLSIFTTKLRGMKKCISVFEDPDGNLLTLDGEIDTFLAQVTPSSAGCKRKRNTTENSTPSKQKVSDGQSVAPFPVLPSDDEDTPTTTPLKPQRFSSGRAVAPFPVLPSDDDDEIKIVEGPSPTKCARQESPAPVAGPSSLPMASSTKPGDTNSRWFGFLAKTCDELEEAIDSFQPMSSPHPPRRSLRLKRKLEIESPSKASKRMKRPDHPKASEHLPSKRTAPKSNDSQSQRIPSSRLISPSNSGPSNESGASNAGLCHCTSHD
ncbi:hypothetical protein BT96DRAFT_995105 [Gymnopus androsaceus JB14]|uniref:Uncharacterized protein n=1 Tax=Gymnopus androsaceus JB14 TaxID=1447944 RepID=A0A6A4HMB7_9AGAR|nr:hypothetical protein BT96DRAFT_995105 [Gymnopus androsaceus JB14]